MRTMLLPCAFFAAFLSWTAHYANGLPHHPSQEKESLHHLFRRSGHIGSAYANGVLKEVKVLVLFLLAHSSVSAFSPSSAGACLGLRNPTLTKPCNLVTIPRAVFKLNQWRSRSRHICCTSKQEVPCGSTTPRTARTLLAHNATLLEHIEASARDLELAPDMQLSALLNSHGSKAHVEFRTDAAELLYRAAVDVDPEYVNAWANLAMLLLDQRSDPKAAEKAIKRAMLLSGTHEDAQHYRILGQCHNALHGVGAGSSFFDSADKIARSKASSATITIHEPPDIISDVPVKHKVTLEMPGRKFDVVRLANQPHVFLVRGFATPAECDAVISAATEAAPPHTETDGRIDESSHGDVYASLDNSRQRLQQRQGCVVTWLSIDAQQAPLVANLVSDAISLVAAGQMAALEPFQVVRYAPGGEFSLHTDASESLPRFATALFYLNEPQKSSDSTAVGSCGGTWFPFAQHGASDAPFLSTMEDVYISDSDLYPDSNWEKSGTSRLRPDRNGIVVEPRRGDMLLFYSLWLQEQSDGQGKYLAPNPHSLHAGLPAPATKWIANLWFQTPEPE